MPEILYWISFGLTVAVLALLIVILVRRPKNNTRDAFQEMRHDINNSITNAVSSLGNILSKAQSDNNELLLKSISAFFQQGIERDSKFAMETEQKLENIRQSLEKSLGGIRETVENSLTRLQSENAQKLEEIRNMVDEKLQKTLEDRISQSFRLVSERLEAVYKGLGEMQAIAGDVGDLKKVLANVKTRGVLGEIQLGSILEQILAPDQYVAEFPTKIGSSDRVDYAVKLPGPNENESVYLPIDAKFPLDKYMSLLDAYDSVDPNAVKQAKKDLETTLLKEAKDINQKYIDVPNTTEFAIMFLPIEGLYAETLNLGVVERMQREYRVNIAGPTTMAALLNSLRMGFKTLLIQKRSGEVWKILNRVKTEFDKFGKVLAETQQRISQANKQLDELVGVRTRKIQKELEHIQNVSEIDSKIDKEVVLMTAEGGKEED
jgi:DNA recombination protein RmuC